LTQKGVLKRFSLKCIGKQETMETILEEKTKKHEELKLKRDTIEYKKWFLRYNPEIEQCTKNKTKTEKTKTKKTKINTTKKSRKSNRKSSEFLF